MFRLVLVVFLLFGFARSVFGQQNEPPEVAATDVMPGIPLPAELDRVLRDYERGWRGRDAEALAALFTPDGFILRPGHPPVRGRDAIAEAYRNAGGPLHLRAFSFHRADSVAYIIGGYGSAPERPDSGKFILTLHRMPDGRWYITADMDNANR